MTVRLIRPFHVRLDVRTGKAEMSRPRAASNNGGGTPPGLPDQKKSSDAGSIKVMRDDRPIVEERREPSFSPPLKSSDNEPIKVVRDGKAGTDEYAHAPLPRRTETSDGSAIKVLRDHKAGTDDYARAAVPPRTETSADTVAEERREPSLSPPPKSSEEGPADALRNEKIVIEDLEREHQFRAALASSVEAGNRLVHRQERLETRTIVRIAAAVIVVGLGFTALLPSILTRNPVEPTVTLTTSPAVAQPVQTEQVGAAQPAPEPRADPLPAAAPPAAAAPRAPALPSNDATSVAKAPPVLRGSNTPDVQGEPRATTQSAGKADGGLALTAAERAAVTRGLQELEKRAAVAEPRRAPSARPQLTAEEQAAVERGLRELEKTAGQAKP
jgi:hypothetical protein